MSGEKNICIVGAGRMGIGISTAILLANRGYRIELVDLKERERGKDLIRAVIYTERDTQKAILIGKKGSALKKIGQGARNQIEKFLEREVYLDLRVKVRKDWRRDDMQIKRFGYS